MEDNKTILELYENYMDDIYTMTSEKLEISNKISKQEQLFLRTLTDEQKELIDTLNLYQEEKEELVRRQVFVFAYKLATNLLIESLDKNT